MENLNAVIDKIKSLVDELSLQAHLGFKELEKEVEGLKKEKEASKEEWSDFIWDKVTDLVDGLSEKYKWEDIKVDKETTEDIN